MNTLLTNGETIEVVAPSGGYSSGQPVKVGSLVGISSNKYLQNDTAVISLRGVHQVAKAVGAWSAGALLYWDDTNKVFTTTNTSNTFSGYAYRDAQSADGSGYILLRQ